MKNNFSDYIRKLFFSRNMLSRLILINIIVFILANIANLFYTLYQVPHNYSLFTEWLAAPSSPLMLLRKPWTLFTYMFLQENFLHLLFNMIMLYFGGTLFMQYLGSRKLLSTYIIGGVTGAAFYIIAFNYFPVFRPLAGLSIPLLGSSASVIAVLIAIAVYIPDYSVMLMFIGRLKMKYIALILVVIDILSIEKENPGGHIAHLGGAVWGFMYIMFYKNNFKLFNLQGPLIRFFKNIFKKNPRLKVEYKKGRPLTDDEYNEIKADNQKKMDAILDKISKSGYNHLTKEEKEFLFSASKKR
jgi:membrane associated rhomboid family serine protease